MENRFKKLIQDSEKKEIENKDLTKKNETLIYKLQENERNLFSSPSNAAKYDTLAKANRDLKNENKNLIEALKNLEQKIIGLKF